MKTLEEDGYLQAKEKSLRKNQSCRHLDLKLASLQNREEINVCYLSHPVCGICSNSPS